MNKFITVLFAAVVLAGCASEPRLQTGPDAETKGELVRVDGVKVDSVFVLPGIDVSQYTSVYIEPLDMSNTEVDFDNQSSRKPWQDWVLTDKDRMAFDEYYQKSMSKALAEHGLTQADEPGAGVLVVKSAMLKLAPLAPKDDFKNRDPGVDYVSEGAGDLTIETQLLDGASNQLLALIEDKRAAGNVWEKNTAFNNRIEVRRVFDAWSRLFANRLQGLQAK